MNLRAIIPAAGKGTRLGSSAEDAPKVMRICAGRPLLETVLSETDFIAPEDTYIVVGYKKEAIVGRFGDRYNYVEQTEQLGTGHAVMVCADRFRDFDGTVLVTFGDMPLFRKADMREMCRLHAEHGAACTLMTAENPDLTLWARIVRGGNGEFASIVEGRDCTPAQARIRELFAGVLVFDSRALFETLPMIRTNNAQHEYYLTEVPELMVRRGLRVDTFRIADGDDLRGVNTKEDLAVCERILSERLARSRG